MPSDSRVYEGPLWRVNEPSGNIVKSVFRFFHTMNRKMIGKKKSDVFKTDPVPRATKSSDKRNRRGGRQHINVIIVEISSIVRAVVYLSWTPPSPPQHRARCSVMEKKKKIGKKKRNIYNLTRNTSAHALAWFTSTSTFRYTWKKINKYIRKYGKTHAHACSKYNIVYI